MNEAVKERIKKRYGRTTANGSKEIRHHGDCQIFAVRSRSVCTCGLIHDLLPYAGNEQLVLDLYPEFSNDVQKHFAGLSGD